MLEYRMRIDFDEDRWFQVEVTADGGELGEGPYNLTFTTGENPLTVSMGERNKILAAVATAVEAITRYLS